MIYHFITVKEFDEKKERSRINKVFAKEPKIRGKLIQILDLFLEGQYEEVCNLINSLEYDKKHYCHQKDYVSEFVYDSLLEIRENKRIIRDGGWVFLPIK